MAATPVLGMYGAHQPRWMTSCAAFRASAWAMSPSSSCPRLIPQQVASLPSRASSALTARRFITQFPSVQGSWRYLVDPDGQHYALADALQRGQNACPLFKGGMTAFMPLPLKWAKKTAWCRSARCSAGRWRRPIQPRPGCFASTHHQRDVGKTASWPIAAAKCCVTRSAAVKTAAFTPCP